MINFKDEYRKANENIVPNPALLQSLSLRLSEEAAKNDRKKSFFASAHHSVRILTAAACAVLIIGAAIFIPRAVGVGKDATAHESLTDRSTICTSQASSFYTSQENSVENNLAADQDSDANAIPNAAEDEAPREDGILGIFGGNDEKEETGATSSLESAGAMNVSFSCIDEAYRAYMYVFRPLDVGSLGLTEATLPEDITSRYDGYTVYLVNDSKITDIKALNSYILSYFTFNAASKILSIAPTEYFENDGKLYVACKKTNTNHICTITSSYYTGSDTLNCVFTFESDLGNGTATFVYDNEMGTYVLSQCTNPEILFNGTYISE